LVALETRNRFLLYIGNRTLHNDHRIIVLPIITLSVS